MLNVVFNSITCGNMLIYHVPHLYMFVDINLIEVGMTNIQGALIYLQNSLGVVTKASVRS